MGRTSRPAAGLVVAEVETPAPPPRFRGTVAAEAALKPGQTVEIRWEGVSDPRHGGLPGTVLEVTSAPASRLIFAVAPRLGKRGVERPRPARRGAAAHPA